MSQRENLPHSDQHLGAGDPETKSTSLRKGTLGLFGIIFFVVAAAAPVAGMTGAFPVAIGIGDGAGAAGMYIAVGIVLLLFSVGYATMSHYVTNTGAFFAYVGRGLGIVPGVGSAFVSTLAYLTVQWAVLGFLAGQLDFYMQAKFSFDIEWWIYAIILIVVVWVLSAMSVDIGAKVLGIFLTIEIIALLVLAFSILFQGGADGIDVGASFNPSNIFAGGLSGGAGIAFAFALASFIGFEAKITLPADARLLAQFDKVQEAALVAALKWAPSRAEATSRRMASDAAEYLRGSQERGDIVYSGRVEEHAGGGVDIGLLWTLTERNFVILTGQ
jgi:amino acid transporter